MTDECAECNDTGWVSYTPTQRQRSLAKQFGWEVPDFFDRPCSSCGKTQIVEFFKPCRCVEAHDGAINETCAPCAAYFDWEEACRD